jgi:4-diphosphocytidyl-2-C-methyl-D-erythritol kinase
MLKNDISLAVMIYFSPAKINLGLQILERRDDGFHNLRSVMYPIPLCDIIEISQFPGQDTPLHFSQTGINTGGKIQNNLCQSAWKLMASEREIPPIAMHLHKQIPVGAGLGGGSSNASTVLKGLNALADSPLSAAKLSKLAAELGSDCPFFLQSQTMMMEDLRQLIEAPLHRWKDQVVNDFERSIFERYPLLFEHKKALLGAGALYASMSGSGSSLYGIFERQPELPERIRKFVIWEGFI